MPTNEMNPTKGLAYYIKRSRDRQKLVTELATELTETIATSTQNWEEVERLRELSLKHIEENLNSKITNRKLREGIEALFEDIIDRHPEIREQKKFECPYFQNLAELIGYWEEK